MNEQAENKTFLKASRLHKSYRLGKTEVPVLKGVDIDVKRGEWVALLGKSGSGKTTLLNLLGTLERPDKGEVVYEGTKLSSLSARQSVQFRCNKIGFIFQAYHMFPELSVLENVFLPGMLNRKGGKELREKGAELLKRVGLGHRVTHRPNELSGGEQQRAAIARALINSPQLILADEPTGNLDSQTGAGILDIFSSLHGQDSSTTILMVTHDRNVARLADRIVMLKDGVIVNENENNNNG